MKSRETVQNPHKKSTKEVGEVVEALAKEFRWPVIQREMGGEIVYISPIKDDPPFGRVVWIIDTHRNCLRCLLVVTLRWDDSRVNDAIRFAALVNQGLPFGCLEFNFQDSLLVFRDTIDLDWGQTPSLVNTVTSRVLELGRRYREALRAAHAGLETPDVAVAKAEIRRDVD